MLPVQRSNLSPVAYTFPNLYLSLNTEDSATEAEATAAKVKKINIRFMAGTELKEAIAKAQFTDSATLSNK